MKLPVAVVLLLLVFSDVTFGYESLQHDEEVIESEQRLKEILFKRKPYDKSVRPLGLNSSTTEITFILSLKQILDLQMKNELLKYVVYVRMWWYDRRLQWEPADYSQISEIRLFANQIWTPDIALVNLAMEIDFFKFLPYDSVGFARSDGRVYLSRPAVLTTTCPIDIQLFPFDVQYCKVVFESWAHTADLMTFIPLKDSADIAQYVPHGEMDLISAKAEVVLKKSFTGVWPGITYTFKLQRKPLYFLETFLVPCVLLEIISLLIFALPVECGEKIGLGLSLILSFNVLLLILADSIPVNSTNVPLIMIYFIKALFLTILNVVVSVFVLNLHFRADHGGAVSTKIKWIVMNVLTRITCKNREDVKKFLMKEEEYQRYREELEAKEEANQNSGGIINLKNIDVRGAGAETSKLISSVFRKSEEEELTPEQCYLMAAVVDNFFFVVFFFFDIGVNVLIITGMVKMI